MTEMKSLIIETHSMDQSLMNQIFSWESVNMIKRGISASRYFNAVINEKTKTHQYDCHENNSMKSTQCYDEFYMQKLGCSFPWLNNHEGTLPTCSFHNYISTLEDLIQNATNSGHPIHEELVSFGCTIPNCKNTIWSETKSEVYSYSEDFSDINSEIYQYFPNKAEVFFKKMFYKIHKSSNICKYLFLIISGSLLEICCCIQFC